MTGSRVLAIGGAVALLLVPELVSAQGVSDLTGRRVGRCDIARELGGPLPPECGGRPGASGTAEGTRGRLVIQNPNQAVPQQDRAATASASGAASAPASGGAVASVPQPAPRAQVGRSVALTVLFELNSATLTAAARQQLDELAAVIKANPNDRFAIEGHTDARGGDELNQELSERRAAVAVDYLVQRHGISPDRLEARAYGRTRPLIPADPFDARNRRVQVTVIGS